MKKIVFSSTLVLTFLILLSSCGKDDSPTEPGPGGPNITSFSPTSGTVGTSIFITGQNFSTTASANTVKIGNTTATVTSASATEIFITVPEGATTGAISITVDGQTDTAGTFTVTETIQDAVFPTIENLPEDSFSAGDILTISGSNFDPTANYIIVFAEDITAEVIEVTENSIQVKVPEGTVSGEITLTFNEETKSLGTVIIDASAQFYVFEYTENRLAQVDIDTGEITFIGSDIPYGSNTRNAVIQENKYVGFQMQNSQNETEPNIVSIDLETGSFEVIPIIGVENSSGFDDFIVDSNGRFYIFHDSNIHRLAEVDLNSGELAYIGESVNLNYGSNTRGAVYHKSNNEYIGFAIENENFENEPHLERFNLDTGETITINIPESFLSEGGDFTDLAISSTDELYIFHDSVNKLAKIDIETGELTYLENQTSENTYGLNTRGAIIYENQYIGFEMLDQDFNTAPNIVSLDLETGEVDVVAIVTDNLPESINLTDFVIKR
ncbi:MAG: IPT/TIG domain-containing protein [Bacteroidota bacterium]